MSTAIPTPPNAIIASLLDIASAAYAVKHGKMFPTERLTEVVADDMEKMENALAALDLLPQIEVDGHLTGPARARAHLQSFLESGDDLTSLMEKRTRAFPKMVITLADPTPEQEEALKILLRENRNQPLYPVDSPFAGMPTVVGAADTQVGRIEFEPAQVWNAPVEAPHERRLRPRLIEPTTPGRDEKAVDPVVEANRELLLSRSKVGIEKYGVTLAGSGLSKRELLTHALQESLDLANYLQAELQRSDAERDDARTNMLADTADEALKIINDAALLKNLVELLSEPWSRLTIGEFKGLGWRLDVEPAGDRKARSYCSSSLRQVIVVAHKGEQDHEYPEPEMCAYCGMSFETPCDAPPTGPCEQANNAFHGSDPTKPRPPAPAPETAWTADAVRAAQHAMDNALMLTGRERATTLLVTIKEIMGVPAAKNIINAYGPGKLNDIPDTYLNNVIAAAEEVLKKVVE